MPRANWTLLTITWIAAVVILVTMAYKLMFQKQVGRTASCLDQASTTELYASPSATVENYASCIAWIGGNAKISADAARHARCRYAGKWTATRGSATYLVTLDADGSFLAEPGQNVPATEQAITGAWTVAANTLVWAYDGGPSWPPDINRVSAESESAFSLTEVNRSITRYTLIERAPASVCLK